MINQAMSINKVEISHKTVLFTVFLLLGLWVMYQIRSILVLIFISFILMTAINPIARWSQKKKLPVLPVIMVVYLGVIALISLVVASLIPAFVDQSKSLIQNLPTYILMIENTYNVTIDPGIGNGYLASIPSNILKFAVGFFSNIINIMAIFFITYYLILERPLLHRYLLKLFDDKNAEAKAESLVLAIENKVGGWVRGELILMAVIGFMTYFGLLMLGVPYALPLAVLAGILELVPNLGPVIAAIPAILLGLTISPLVAIGATILSILIQQLENNLIVPKIMQSATGTKPLVTIVTLLVGYQLGGIAGAVLAMPIYLTALTTYKHLTDK